MITPDPAADEERRRGLRRMRTIAVGLLVLAAVVYVATRGQDGWLGFVNAGAEASMVGAMADWFAVTALFKHPLGLPIPHTALVPKRKDELGRGLQEFVGENFLQEAIIRDRVAAAAISLRVGRWLNDPVNARRVVDEAAEVATIALGKVTDGHVRGFVQDALVPRFHEEPISPMLGGLLDEVVRDDLHHGLVDLAVDEVASWLVENPDTLRRGAGGARALVGAAAAQRRSDPAAAPRAGRLAARHPSRPEAPRPTGAGLDARQLAQDLQTDPDTQARTEKLKDRLLDHPQVLASSVDLWNALRRALQASLVDPEGAVRARILTELTAFAQRLVDDPDLRKRLDLLAADAAVFVVDRYGAELTAVITHTIERWDGKEAARRIELHVGRDLQFIRINGTIVGGLVGVVIHTFSLAI